MSSRPLVVAASLLPLLASLSAAQPRVDATAGAGAVAPGGSAAASVTAGAVNAPGMTVSPLTNGMGTAPVPGAAPSASLQTGAPGAVAPAANPGLVSPAGRVVPTPGTIVPSPETGAPKAGAVTSRPAATPPAASARNPRTTHDPAARAPNAGAALDGAAGKIDAARRAVASGGDAVSVTRELDKVFDAQTARSALQSSPAAGVAGSAQGVRDAIKQKVSIANTAAPSDAPSLYQDAIKTAKDALPAPVANAVARVVRGFAARKADASLGDLAQGAYRAAASGSGAETGRQLSAFDKWETLLGAPGRPLVTNAPALKADVKGVLEKANSGASPSVPHVWFAKKDGAYTAVLPGSGVTAVPALAAAFALAPSALAPETALSDAYRAFSADPRASTGAGLIYRARRTLGASVPAAALSAGKFWLRELLSAAWRRVVAFFSGGKAYALASKTGQDSLRRDAALARAARAEASAAARALSAERLTVGGLRSAFASLGRAASSLGALNGDDGASALVASLGRSFEAEAAARGLRPADAWPADGAAFVTAPGGPAHWARRIEQEASRSLNGRFWRAGAAASVNLGAPDSAATDAAARVRELSPSPVTTVALDDRLWARGRGEHGEARLSAELRSTALGGSVELTVERGDAALARRLEDLGLTVFADGASLRAVAGAEDFSHDAAALQLIAARALSAALGAAPEADAGADLRALAEEARREPARSAELAALFDGREAFARAPVIGRVGDYEALAPTAVSVDGKPLLVSALRDPDTGLLSYARAAAPGGKPLGAAEVRALLRAR